MLTAELGIKPEPDTAALAERIRTQALPLHPHIRHAAPRSRHPDTPVAFLGNLFAGRTIEYQELVHSYERAAAGQPQLVVLRGEAGIGKTRLARKFLA
ncbi:MAG: ATP-binding protein [Anaerolineales bacterium]|nr:ATP-binding protein [Anaerolineales bacterium]